MLDLEGFAHNVLTRVTRFLFCLQIPVLGFFRSDYMFHIDHSTGKTSAKQVEVNTTDAAYHGIGARNMRQLHEMNLKRAGRHDLLPNLPDNHATREAAKVFVSAWNTYGSREAIILFVVDQDRYIFDQRLFEYEITAQEPAVRVRRKTMAGISTSMTVDSIGRLFV